jgi:transposase-like protein
MHSSCVDSAGETIAFMLSPKRDLIAAKLFLRLALSGGGPGPRVINVDGHPPYASAVAQLKQTSELSRRCCRTAPYLNDIIEQDHWFINKRITASLGFRSVEGACRSNRKLRGDARNPQRSDPLVANGAVLYRNASSSIPSSALPRTPTRSTS